MIAIARVASAQEHVIVVEPPHARGVSVAYPENGHGDAAVILELFVGVDGRVRDVRVIAGAEPFLSAARSASSTFTFDPATRDGKPAAARVRIEIPFHDANVIVPPIQLETIEIVAPTRMVLPVIASKRGDSVEDVHVRGTRKEIGGSTISKEEVRDLPGAFGDAFRAIDMMPGVVPIFSGVPYFFVRGAPPGNTGYFLDDVRVPLLYHLALGPSVVHPSLIDRVDFYPGGYPAQYGRFTGGIVAGETRGPQSHLTGEAELRLFDVGALGEAQFANGKGDALVAGRYGYPSLLVPLFAPANQLAYWDYQGRLSYRVTPRDTLTAFVFGSFDELDQRDFVNGTSNYGPYYPVVRTEFHRADLRWDHSVPGGNLRTALTFGVDDSLFGGGAGNQPTSVQGTSIQLRSELDRQVTRDVRLRAGADALLYHYDYTQTLDPSGDAISITTPARNDVMMGAHADIVWRVHPRVEIVPGIRFDIFTSRSEGDVAPNSAISLVTGDRAVAAPAVDPRLAARVDVTKGFTWVSTFAITHQPPSFVIPLPGGELGSLSNGLQTAVQASQGFEAKLPLALDLKATFFIQHYFSLTDAFTTCDLFSNIDVRCIDARTNGQSAGIELMLRRSFSKRIGGWISYTFSRSTVEVPHPLRNQPSNVPSNFDRPNVLNVALAFDLGKGWHAGARFTYYTGLPYTQTQDGIPVPPYNGLRLADFWRIDARLEKRWRLGAHAQIALVFEGLNVTFNKEQIAIECQPQLGSRFGPPMLDKCTPQTIGPVSVPSIGLEAKYY